MEVKAGFDKVGARIDDQLESVRRLILQVGGGVLGTVIIGILTVLGSHS